MKHLKMIVLASFSLVGCAADPDLVEDENAPIAPVDVNENHPQARIGLKLDDSKYCLPGEEVKCTLGPPPVCSCVTKSVAYSGFFLAR